MKIFNKQMRSIPRAFLMLDVPFGCVIVEANSTSFVKYAILEAIKDLIFALLQGMGDARPLSTSKIQVLSYWNLGHVGSARVEQVQRLRKITTCYNLQ